MYCTTALFTAAVVFVAICCITGPVDSYYLDLRQPADEMIDLIKRNDVNIEDLFTIDKRYTKAQDTAIEICTGECMFIERLAYGDCYQLCHWTGQGPSPWVAFYRSREAERAAKDRDKLAQGSMMRSGRLSGRRSSRGFDQGRSSGGQLSPESTRIALQRRKLAQSQARNRFVDQGRPSNRRRLRMSLIPRYKDYDY